MPRSSRSFDDTDDNDRGNWSVNNSLSVPILSEEETESESTELENQRSSSEYARFFSNNLGQTPNGYTLTPFTRSPVKFFRERFRAGSVKGSVFTLVVALVGAGTLSVPLAIQKSGLLLGTLMFIFGAFLAIFSIKILIICAEATGARTYPKLALKLYGHRTSFITNIFLICNLYGTTVSYIVASGNLTAKVLQLFFGYSHIQTDIPDFLHPSAVVLFLTFAISLPLSLFRTMGALRYSSLLGVIFSSYLCFIAVVKYFGFCLDSANVEIADKGYYNKQVVQCFWKPKPINSSKIVLISNQILDILTSLPIVVYAFTCHPNVFPVFLELRNPSQRRMNKVITNAIGISLFLYLGLGISAYLTFKDQLEHSNGNFLLNDYHKDTFVLIAAVGISISITLAIPLIVNAFRSVAYITILSLFDDEYSYLSEDSEAKEIPPFWHYFLSIGMITAAVAPAILVKDISSIFTVLGGTTNPVICYILPALFIQRAASHGELVWTKRLALAIAIVIPGVSFFSLAQQLSQRTL